MSPRIPADVFPPGEFLKDELEARNWTQVEFAEIIGKDTRLIYEVINGKRAITPETAMVFSQALGTSPELWMNLESQYQLSKVRSMETSVSRKAMLHSKFPVREMIKRGWINATQSIDVLEKQVFDFFGISSIDEPFSFNHAAKKTSYETESMQQMAWLFRVRKVASSVLTKSYSEAALRNGLAQLSSLLWAPEEARHVPKILAECGVRFVVVESLVGSKIDGVCFWLDAKSPVIGITMQRDRIDNFWFVLRHEIEHVLNKDGQKNACLDLAVESANEKDIPEEERVANKAAAEFCVSQRDLKDFMARVQPYFSEQRILLFAQKLKVHPGLVVGQIQRKLDRHDFLKKHQVKIRQIVTSVAITDGWGSSFPIE
jgi:HTH-type transcriptional regulator/antitoxin HigA